MIEDGDRPSPLARLKLAKHPMTRRMFVAAAGGAAAGTALLGLRPAAAQPVAPLDPAATVTRIAFGSCADQAKEQLIWSPILAQDPDLFIFLGDNVYVDRGEVVDFEQAYALLGARLGFRELRSRTPVLATWDDHDYGENDAGAAFPLKEEARRIFCDFFGVPADSPRRTRPDGLYDAVALGPEGQRVQILLLDLRWNRSPQAEVSEAAAEIREGMNMGPYAPTDYPAQTILGEGQWTWLEERFREPADLRVVASSLPFLMDFTGWETWTNYPREKQRMIDLIAATRADGVVFISGDTHWAEFSRMDADVPYPLWDVTSSGLTEEWDQVSPNRYRVGHFTWHRNFGLFDVDWPARQLRAEIRNVAGAVVLAQDIALDDLRV